MKINQHNLLAGLLLVSMTFSSCLETHVTNRVNRDGSVHRTVVCKSDDCDDFEYGNYPVPLDDSWMKSLSFEVDTTPDEPGNIFPDHDTTWIYTYAKDFESAEELNILYRTGNDRFNHTTRRVEFLRKFNWFFSRILFTETIEPIVKGVDPLTFFSEREYEVFLMNDPELERYIDHPDSIQRKEFVEHVETKTEDWMTMCLAEDYLSRLASYAVEQNVDIDEDTILSKRDLFIEKVEGESDLPELTALIFDSAPEVLFGDGISVFFEETERFYEDVFDIGGSSYTMDFVMPGTLTSANGEIINKQRVRWDVSSERFFAMPFVMEAESRVVNLWAWIVSAVFIVFVFTGLFKKKKAAL